MLIISKHPESIIAELGRVVVGQTTAIEIAVQRLARLDRGPLSDAERACYTQGALAALAEAHDKQARVMQLANVLDGVIRWVPGAES